MAEKSVEKEVSSSKTVSISPKKEAIVFVSLTLGLTFLLNTVMWINYNLIAENIELLALGLQFQMLIPAFSAIILNLFVFKKTYTQKPKILFYYFLVLTAIFTLVFAVRLSNPIELTSIQLDSIENLGPLVLIGLLSLITTILTFGWIGLIFYWNIKSDSRKELRAAKLSFGKPSYYLLFGLFIFGYFLLSTILNWSFNLGNPPNQPIEFSSFLLASATIILGPILALPQYFGEEYGWRIYLQDKLAQQYGRFKAVLLVGIVWGLWHAPIIAGAGLNYPGYPVVGTLLFTIFTILISIPMGLAVFKSKSVWLAVFLHGILNGSANVLAFYVYNPSDPVYSFGIGIYGLLVLCAITLVFIKSKNWKKRVD